jgi:hypothetical protein
MEFYKCFGCKKTASEGKRVYWSAAGVAKGEFRFKLFDV